MEDLYIAKVYRPGGIFMALILWVYRHHFYTASPAKDIIGSGCALRSFRVIQGHQTWYQPKAHMRLPISLLL